MSKKKKNKYLFPIVLIVLLCALAVGYAVLSTANKKNAALDKEAQESASEPVMIAEFDPSSAVEISFSKNGGDMIVFLKKDGKWTYSPDDTFPLDEEKVSKMASALSSISVIREVNEGDESEYGLTEPAYTMDIKYSDGASHEYKIGDYNSFGGGYYFSADGKIYLIKSGLGNYFDYELSDFLVLDSIPSDIEEDYIVSVTVKKDGKENVITDKDGIKSVFSAIKSLKFDICADYYAEAEEKSSHFGIDGNNSVEIKYKKAVISGDTDGNETETRLDSSYKLLFGDDAGHDSGFYSSPENSTIVYTEDRAAVLDILGYVGYAPQPDETTQWG